MKILIVDDEEIAIEGILACLNFEDYGIEGTFSANSMRQAQDILSKENVQIVMCDIEMPNGSGLELIEWINQNYPDIVTIILSCHTEFAFAQKAVSLECLQYMLKPATPDVLGPVIKKAVRQAQEKVSRGRFEKLGEEYVQKLAGTSEEADAVEKVKQYIADHVEEELMVEQLAGMVYLSPNHLTRSFKKKYGKTVTEYIADYRLGLAEELLRTTNLTVTMISAKVGYPNYAYFTRQFKRYSGYTPSEYRNRFGRSE